MAVAMEWVARITTVGLEMVLPGVFGFWLDGKWGTSFLGLLGFGLGFVLGFWHLLKLTGAANRRKQQDSAKSDNEQ